VNGKLNIGLSREWKARHVTPEVEAMAERIPAGHVVYVVATDTTGRHWRVDMFPEASPHVREWSIEVRGASLERALDFALTKHGYPGGVVVTTDAQGWVTSIEGA
jgi:hypothetical protein